MGAQKSYRPSGGFSEYLYHQVGETIVADGISGKVIKRIELDNTHDGLPLYSNSSRVYFRFLSVRLNLLRNKLLAKYLRSGGNELATVRISAFCVAMLSNNSLTKQK